MNSQKIDYNYSLFGRFISIIFLVFLSLGFCFVWKTNNVRKEILDNHLLYTASTIASDISNNFLYNENKISFIATLIANKKTELSPKDISELLQLYSYNHNGEFIKWSNIEWADKNHQVQVYDLKILENKIDVGYRSMFDEIVKKPFTMVFGKIDYEFIKKRKVIPIAMGIVDKKNNYLGSLVTAIDIKVLEKAILKTIKEKNVSFALISEVNKDVIIHSPDFIEVQKNIPSIESLLGSKETSQEKIKFSSCKLNYYPFTVLTYAKLDSLSYKKYLSILAPIKIEIGVGILMIIILIYLFYASILNPFMLLSKAALSISNGETSEDIPVINSKEGALVASALEKIKTHFITEKELLQKLSTAHNKLSITNLRLENKVTARTHELKEALDTKRKFLDHLSHEIKIPIQGITVISENLAANWNGYPDSKRFDHAQQIAHSSQRLYSLVSNLLELSKFANGKIPLNPVRLDLVELTHEMIAESKILYMYNNPINIHFTAITPIIIVADKERITQVLRNLFVNAIKFSSPNGLIAVKIDRTEICDKNDHLLEAVHFKILDQGVGIEEEELISIFDPFTQGKAAIKKPASIGLGLSICREIIKTHNGKIWATNNKDGGATFNFILPISQPSELNNDTSNPATRDLHNLKPNILIIDDEETCLNSMEMLLQGTSYNLVKSNSGVNGLKYLQENYSSIAIVMLDLMIPDMYGLNILSEIKNSKNLAHIPIILQTGISDEEEIIKACNMGIFCFIRKPYNKERIISEMERAMRLRKLNCETEAVN